MMELLTWIFTTANILFIISFATKSMNTIHKLNMRVDAMQADIERLNRSNLEKEIR